MSELERLKLKDTKLINEICNLGDIAIDKRRRWSIEFDDYGMQGVIDLMRKNFVEQACEVIDAIEEGLQPLIGNYNNGISKAEAKQAIRDKFK